MPYLNRFRQRAFQREWHAQRRAAWFEAHGPCLRCQSWTDLELHHRDPDQKVSHKVFSWARARRDAELAKCDVLCRACHTAHHAALGQTIPRLGEGRNRR